MFPLLFELKSHLDMASIYQVIVAEEKLKNFIPMPNYRVKHTGSAHATLHSFSRGNKPLMLSTNTPSFNHVLFQTEQIHSKSQGNQENNMGMTPRAYYVHNKHQGWSHSGSKWGGGTVQNCLPPTPLPALAL